jgi:hypothetical protein
MFAPERFGRVFGKCCEAIGQASMFLLPTFFLASFVVMACLVFSSSRLIILLALIFCCSMHAVTCMLLAETRRYKRSTAFPSGSKPGGRFSTESRTRSEHACVYEDTSSCGLCGHGAARYRLDCQWRKERIAKHGDDIESARAVEREHLNINEKTVIFRHWAVPYNSVLKRFFNRGGA